MDIKLAGYPAMALVRTPYIRLDSELISDRMPNMQMTANKNPNSSPDADYLAGYTRAGYQIGNKAE